MHLYLKLLTHNSPYMNSKLQVMCLIRILLGFLAWYPPLESQFRHDRNQTEKAREGVDPLKI